VPREAVQRIGRESVVFVRAADGRYEPRVVVVGRSQARLVEVRGDLREDDPVAVEGAFLLKTELLRGEIGAGCCEVGFRTET